MHILYLKINRKCKLYTARHLPDAAEKTTHVIFKDDLCTNGPTHTIFSH